MGDSALPSAPLRCEYILRRLASTSQRKDSHPIPCWHLNFVITGSETVKKINSCYLTYVVYCILFCLVGLTRNPEARNLILKQWNKLKMVRRQRLNPSQVSRPSSESKNPTKTMLSGQEPETREIIGSGENPLLLLC